MRADSLVSIDTLLAFRSFITKLSIADMCSGCNLVLIQVEVVVVVNA